MRLVSCRKRRFSTTSIRISSTSTSGSRRELVIKGKLDHSEAGYYKARNRFNALLKSKAFNTAEAAALFYYLNRTGYNGLCRFNSSGGFNVPFGRKPAPSRSASAAAGMRTCRRSTGHRRGCRLVVCAHRKRSKRYLTTIKTSTAKLAVTKRSIASARCPPRGQGRSSPASSRCAAASGSGLRQQLGERLVVR